MTCGSVEWLRVRPVPPRAAKARLQYKSILTSIEPEQTRLLSIPCAADCPRELFMSTLRKSLVQQSTGAQHTDRLVEWNCCACSEEKRTAIFTEEQPQSRLASVVLS